MNNGLNRSYAGDPSMEVVVCSKIPTSNPHQHVVTHSKEPNYGEVGKRDDARAIRHISKKLLLFRGETIDENLVRRCPSWLPL